MVSAAILHCPHCGGRSCGHVCYECTEAEPYNDAVTSGDIDDPIAALYSALEPEDEL